MKRAALLSLVLSLALSGSVAAAGKSPGASAEGTSLRPEFRSTVFDFGHLGIDYTVYHRFPLVNPTPDTVRILSVVAHCDCSSAICPDSLILPGDSTTINLRYSTKNFYGPQNKSITVTTDHPAMKNIELFYLSIIGQWFNGLRPDPEALFFLQANQPKKISIPNRNFDQIQLTNVSQIDHNFEIKVLTSKAKRNQAIELEIRPSGDIAKGTLHSNLTLQIDSSDGDPTILTIPVKIVRY